MQCLRAQATTLCAAPHRQKAHRAGMLGDRACLARRAHAHSKDIHMRKKIALTCLIATTLMLPVLAYASDDRDSDRSHPKTFVKDSVITSKIKTKLAAEHPGSMARVHVDTDDHGVVWLSGHVRSEEQRERAVAIARETEGVTEVKNHLHIKKDD
jgi:hyperosmotically inducible protein